MKSEKETPESDADKALKTIDDAITKLKDGDDGAHWEPDVIEAARLISKNDKPLFQRKRSELKKASSDAQIGEWTKEVHASGTPNETEDGQGQGRAIKLYEPEPWNDPVDGASVLTEAYNVIMRHMVMREEDAIACVLWAVHTYIYEIFSHTPRLMISAPDAECGKTVLMTHMVGNLVNRPLPIENMKPAPFFRLAETEHPTYLLDEGDVFLSTDSDLLAGFNNGWEPHGGVIRCVGDDYEARLFSSHCPVAIAGIRIHEKLPATTVSRSIVINLERAARSEIKKEDIYNAKYHRKALLVIGRKISRWCRDHKDEIYSTKPQLPTDVRNRLADKWEPMFAIAQVAGGDWPKKAKKALLGQVDMSEPSKGTILLTDILSVLTPGEEHISTKELIRRLCAMEDSPWADYNFKERDLDRRQIKDRQMARLLKPYNIHSKGVRISATSTPRGYEREPIKKAVDRYVPADTPETSATVQQSSNHAGFSDIASATSANDVADRKARKPRQDAGCCTVADNLGGTQREEVSVNNNCNFSDAPDEPLISNSHREEI